jgi:hypothetical protein
MLGFKAERVFELDRSLFTRSKAETKSATFLNSVVFHIPASRVHFYLAFHS